MKRLIWMKCPACIGGSVEIKLPKFMKGKKAIYLSGYFPTRKRCLMCNGYAKIAKKKGKKRLWNVREK